MRTRRPDRAGHRHPRPQRPGVERPVSQALAARTHADRAAAATARLQALRVRSHQAGPHSIVHDLGDDIAELHHLAGGTAPDAANPVWPVILRYAELLGWTAQEIGQDKTAQHWNRTVADGRAGSGIPTPWATP